MALVTVAGVLLSGCALSNPELARLPAEPSWPTSEAFVKVTDTAALQAAVDSAATEFEMRNSACQTADKKADQAPSAQRASLRTQALAACDDADVAKAALDEQIRKRRIAEITHEGLRVANSSGRLFEIVIEARRMGEVYSSGQRKSARLQTAFELPVLGAAAAGAGILLANVNRTGPKAEQKTKDSLRTLGEIGIGIGVFTVARDRLLPANLPAIYLGGYRAMVCIIAEEQWFLSIDSLNNHAKFEAALGAVSVAIETTQQAVGAEQIKPKPDTAAIALALARIEQAVTAMNAAQAQMAAFRSRETVFLNALTDSSASVTRRALIRTSMDYQALLKQLTPTAPATTSDQTKESASTPTPPSLFDQAKLLDFKRRTLEGLTPNYSEALKRVSECPARVTAET